MTLKEVEKEFNDLDWDFRNVPDRAQAERHEKSIIRKFLTDSKDPVADYILSHLRYI